MKLLVGLILSAWLMVGAVAADQRAYLAHGVGDCTIAATTGLTIAAGPLNYQGVNPSVNCRVPSPST